MNKNFSFLTAKFVILCTKDLNDLLNKGLRAVDVTVRKKGENYD